MTEEETQDRNDEDPGTEAPEEPVAEEAAPAADEPAAEEPVAEEAAPEEPVAEEPAEDAETETAAEGPLHPKEARRRRRSAHTGEARPQRDAGQRQAERDTARAEKAGRRRAYRARARSKAAERRASQPPVEPQAPVRRPGRAAKVRQGVVVSDRPDKTITVRVDITRRHRRYEKTIRSSSTLHAHDERNEARAGDTVRVVETRPLSRTKRWMLVEVVERAR
jgi:small subunit ribosomal protein S17